MLVLQERNKIEVWNIEQSESIAVLSFEHKDDFRSIHFVDFKERPDEED